jgi:hypothetical protein
LTQGKLAPSSGRWTAAGFFRIMVTPDAPPGASDDVGNLRSAGCHLWSDPARRADS